MDNTLKTLSDYRLEKAQQCYDSAKILYEAGDYKGAANRNYYCVFHAIRSVLALEGIDFKKHAAVLAHFRKHYIKTNKLDIQMSDIISEIYQARTDSDYDDFYIISKSETEEQINRTSIFLKNIREYLEQNKV